MNDRLTVGSLYAGIGGFDLGFERAGMQVLWQCEQDRYCTAVLKKHWPNIPVHPDVRSLVANSSSARTRRTQGDSGSTGKEAVTQSPEVLQSDRTSSTERTKSDSDTTDMSVSVPYVDVLCGGFPCQDISVAGHGAGIEGERSGLWFEFSRLIGEIRPKYVVAENVPILTKRGLNRVLANLAESGYDAEWDCLPASAFGAPHRRDRIWIVAYPTGSGFQRREEPKASRETQPIVTSSRSCTRVGAFDWWVREPKVGRVVDGISSRVGQTRSLGNALVPQIAEWIGKQIVNYEEERKC
jgi:DNA (cytosine-5)-methyltransferase 1